MPCTWAEADLERREREQEEWLRSRPVCDKCGEPIQEDGYYQMDNMNYCEECWQERCRDFYREIE